MTGPGWKTSSYNTCPEARLQRQGCISNSPTLPRNTSISQQRGPFRLPALIRSRQLRGWCKEPSRILRRILNFNSRLDHQFLYSTHNILAPWRDNSYFKARQYSAVPSRGSESGKDGGTRGQGEMGFFSTLPSQGRIQSSQVSPSPCPLWSGAEPLVRGGRINFPLISLSPSLPSSSVTKLKLQPLTAAVEKSPS